MNILIIDDDKFVTRPLEDSLTTHGHNVTVLNRSVSLGENISTIKSYDCIILDLMMRSYPGLKLMAGEETGEGLFRMIKLYDSEKPVIIISGKDPSEIKTNFSRTKTQFIIKPFHARFDDIYKALSNV